MKRCSSSTEATLADDKRCWEGELAEALALVFNRPEDATLLAKKAGIPVSRIPAFTTAEVFWERIVEDACSGILIGGAPALLRAAIEARPGNIALPALESQISDIDQDEKDDHAPVPGSLAVELESAYMKREELVVTGKSTTDINAKILAIKRKMRHGPNLHRGEFLGDGQFRLITAIGDGGFATVWKAYDRQRHKIVAIKVLHGQFARDSTRRERFFRGARKMSELHHAGIVQVLEPYGDEQGFFYYVMEYIPGGDLYEAVIKKRISTRSALEIVATIAGALEVAHLQGMVHRDIKPQNILLRSDEFATLTDFDLVQAKDTTGGTRLGSMGTMLYAAPEQVEDSSGVDHRADIYSLGMTAIFCVYGRPLPRSAIYTRNAFLANLRVTDPLRRFLRQSVSLNPDNRFRSMACFRAELLKILTQATSKRSNEVRSLSRRLISELRKFYGYMRPNHRLVRTTGLVAVILIITKHVPNHDSVEGRPHTPVSVETGPPSRWNGISYRLEFREWQGEMLGPRQYPKHADGRLMLKNRLSAVFRPLTAIDPNANIGIKAWAVATGGGVHTMEIEYRVNQYGLIRVDQSLDSLGLSKGDWTLIFAIGARDKLSNVSMMSSGDMSVRVYQRAVRIAG